MYARLRAVHVCLGAVILVVAAESRRGVAYPFDTGQDCRRVKLAKVG